MLSATMLPVRGLVGGLMIGSASAILLLGTGRIAGISGLAARAFGLGAGAPWPVAAAFIFGLPLGAATLAAAGHAPVLHFPVSLPLLLISGLLVGYGTRLGSGCTSGHGVCGLSRFSIRSIAATVTFMGAGFLTVALTRLSGLSW